MRQRIESVLHDSPALQRLERALPLEAARERVERALPLDVARKRLEQALPERAQEMLPGRKQKKGKRRVFLLVTLLAGLTAFAYVAYRKLSARQATGGDWHHGPGRYDHNVSNSIATAQPEPTPPATELRQAATPSVGAETGNGMSVTAASASRQESIADSPAIIESREQEGLTWNRIRGLPVLDIDGNEIGQVEAAYNRGDEGPPEWIALTTRALNPRRVLVPLDGARVETDYIKVAYPQDLVRDAPAVEDGELTPEQENDLYRHYNLRRIAEADADSLAIDMQPLRLLAGIASGGQG